MSSSCFQTECKGTFFSPRNTKNNHLIWRYFLVNWSIWQFSSWSAVWEAMTWHDGGEWKENDCIEVLIRRNLIYVSLLENRPLYSLCNHWRVVRLICDVTQRFCVEIITGVWSGLKAHTGLHNSSKWQWFWLCQNVSTISFSPNLTYKPNPSQSALVSALCLCVLLPETFLDRLWAMAV